MSIVNILMGIGSPLTGKSTAEASWGKANVLAPQEKHKRSSLSCRALELSSSLVVFGSLQHLMIRSTQLELLIGYLPPSWLF